MTDRKPTYPNRIRITREDGSQEIVTWEYADNPIVEGTLLSKANLLDDTTAQALLPGVEDPTVNQAFAALGNEMQKSRGVTVSLPASGWQGNTAPYTQQVAVDGMTEEWQPSSQRPGTVLSQEEYQSMGLDQKRAIQEALGCLSDVHSSEGQLLFTCYNDKPAVDLTVRVEGVI